VHTLTVKRHAPGFFPSSSYPSRGCKYSNKNFFFYIIFRARVNLTKLPGEVFVILLVIGCVCNVVFVLCYVMCVESA